MNYEKLRSLLSKSNTKASILSIVIMALGGFILYYSIFREDYKGMASLIIGLIFGGMFVIMGLIALKNLLVDAIKAKRNTHPLLMAIKNGQRDYLVWLYIQQINTTVEGNTVGTSKNINYFSKDCKGKGKTIISGGEFSAEEVIEYLKSQFDIPYLDYSNQTRDAINEYFGTSGIKKL